MQHIDKDIFSVIISFLDITSISSLSKTCKHINTLCKSDKIYLDFIEYHSGDKSIDVVIKTNHSNSDYTKTITHTYGVLYQAMIKNNINIIRFYANKKLDRNLLHWILVPYRKAVKYPEYCKMLHIFSIKERTIIELDQHFDYVVYDPVYDSYIMNRKN